ncbi:MAG: low molecular weight protein arginine phosphatase [Ardenticatenaceae bacterium]|nr:low molecular weight protein arginine phosphatase [Ardenticatenaceae bacterium]
MSHILIVCTANICRSPVGEAVLRDRLQKQGLPDWTVASAGTWALDGHSASPHSVTVMAEKGLDLREHLAQTVTGQMLAEADLVLCMELGHVEALQAEFPRHRDKIFLFSEMVGKRYSVADPYGGPLDGYQRMAQEVTNLVDNGLERIITLARANQ